MGESSGTVKAVRHALATMACSAILAANCLTSAEAQARSVSHALDIPAQDLHHALQQLALVSHHKLFYRSELVQGKTSGAVKGTLTTQEALQQLLTGTHLTFEITAGQVVLVKELQEAKSTAPEEPAAGRVEPAKNNAFSPIRLAQSGSSPSSDASHVAPASGPNASTEAADEVVVTGTMIRGAEPSGPVLTITQQQMRLSGHTNLGEVVRAMPQNFSGGQNPGIGLGAGNNANYTGSSSLNLRGLGADATLTLLNGARMPYDGIIQATDVSVIPVAAIDRMEILLDGASAIYGSDAVGGVANIVLKRDYEGAEISARYGVATDGGFEQQQYNAVGGTTWGSGGFLATADFSENTAVYARQRSYLSILPNVGVTIYPISRQQSMLFSGHQQLLENGPEITLDAFYTDRDTRDIGQTAAVFDNQRDAVIWGVAPAVRFNLPGDWSAKVKGAMGRNENTVKLRAYSLTGQELPAVSPVTKYRNDAETFDVGFEGPLLKLPGGVARLSVGAGYREAQFDQIAVVAGRTEVGGANRSKFGYGEINLPLVSPAQSVPLVSRLSLNGAVRYEDYDSFGGVTTPKVGFIWGPVPSFDIKASWGKSFKAPTLTQQYQSGALYLYPSMYFPGLPANTDVMYAGGGDPNLQPERAKVITAGFVARPEFIPGLTVEVSWFDIEYTDRVVQPITSLSQTADPAFADFVTLRPSVDQQNAMFALSNLPAGTFTGNLTGVPYIPANIGGIVSNRYSNATADSADGIDLTARHITETSWGQLAFTANGSWMQGERQLTVRAPQFDAAGTVFFPANFKGRFGAAWSRAGLTLGGALNHIDGVENTMYQPFEQGGSMTTVDLNADYRGNFGMLGEFALNFAVINLFDRRPPFLRSSQTFFPPYDSANYSALGRTVGATVTKRF